MVSAVEDALRAWVKTGSGFLDEFVYFANQKVDRPAGPYITLRVGGVESLGALDAVLETFDEDADPGEEITLTVNGEREVSCSVQVFNAGTNGTGSAVTVLERVKLALGLLSVRDALNEAGISIFDAGNVQDLSSLLGSAFDGRAALEVRAYARDTVSEKTTYIERFGGDAFGQPYQVSE